jgi:fructokinase
LAQTFAFMLASIAKIGGSVKQDRGRQIGAIEAGGTKFVCVTGETPAQPLARAVIPTREPEATLGECLQFFRDAAEAFGPVKALGIASFGPLELRPGNADFGRLFPTPKPGWSGVDVLGFFKAPLGIPVAIDTDVGCAALGEWLYGAGRGLGSLAYVTVGTGVGGAIAPAGNAARQMHAEMGHVTVRRDPLDHGFAGVCPFHGDCLEGLASGPAVRARWNCDLASLAADHPGRSIIAGYVAQLAASITLLQSPEAIVIGGGVATGGDLLPAVRSALQTLLGGYLPHLRSAEQVARLIRPPQLGTDSAIAGAMHMASDALAARY